MLSVTLIQCVGARAQTIVNDDYISLPENSAIEFDPTSNDDHADNLNLLVPPLHGTVIYLPGPEDLRYTPNPGFFGIDSFRYAGCDDSPPFPCDDAWVYILVTESDLDSVITRSVTTYVDLPFAFYSDDLSPDGDTSGFSFDRVAIEIPPALGTATVDTMNLYLEYTPPSFPATDSLLIRVCADDAGLLCRLLKLYVEVIDTCNNDLCVWPGDADRNGIVDHRDLVSIGWAFNDSGFPRDSVNTFFVEQPTTDWANATAGINSKFGDCDGDGLVQATDTTGILQNYGQLTARNVYSPDTLSFSNVPLQIEILIDSVLYGDTTKVIVKTGTPLSPGSNVYAFTASFSYDYPVLASLLEISVDFSNSWITPEGDPQLTLYRADTTAKVLDVALTRTDKVGVSGHGEVFTINLITEDNLDQRPGKIELGVFSEIYGPKRQRKRIQPGWFSFEYATSENIQTNEKLSVNPNIISAGEELFVYFENTRLQPDQYQIFSIEGSWIDSKIPLTSGVYFIQTVFEKNVFTKRLIVQ